MKMIRLALPIPLALVIGLPVGGSEPPRGVGMTAAAIGIGTARAETNSYVPVPVVGCSYDGPLPAPGSRLTQTVAPAAAHRLAYYYSLISAVLAPRGWHCVSRAGSDGSVIIVTPEPHTVDELSRPDATLDGPVVQLSLFSDITKGWAAVPAIPRLFPIDKESIERVIREGLVGAGAYATKPYPDDILRRLSETEVEFETPAGKDGIGTLSRLVKNGDPIRGVAITTNDSLMLLDIRLPPDLRDLVPAIVDAERRFHASRPVARATDIWTCTYPDPATKKLEPVEFDVIGEDLLENDFFQLRFKILQNTADGLVAVWSIAGMEANFPNKKTPTIGAMTMVINKKTGELLRSVTTFDVPDQQNRSIHGTCQLEQPLRNR